MTRFGYHPEAADQPVPARPGWGQPSAAGWGQPSAAGTAGVGTAVVDEPAPAPVPVADPEHDVAVAAVPGAPRRRRGRIEITKQRVKEAELMHFSRQMASFIRAGIPILDAIQVLADGTENRTFAQALGDIRTALQSGETFHAAASAHPRVFPSLYLGMLRSAELTGELDTVLDQLARYLERDLDAKRKIRSALAYPAIILAMSLLTIVVLTAFVLPRFEKFFESLDAELPVVTRILLDGMHLLGSWWFAFAGLGVAAVAGLVAVRRSRSGRRRLDGLLLRLPVVGETVRFAVIERFCRILAAMVKAGVPLPDAMTVAGEGTNNLVYEAALETAREQMLRGEGIARPIADTNLFPASAVQMMRVGEDTGSLDSQLESTAEFYEQELDYKVKHLTTLFEPLVIILMGLIVGFVAIALVSAMYGVFRQSGTI